MELQKDKRQERLSDSFFTSHLKDKFPIKFL